jgi:hypothetical protein
MDRPDAADLDEAQVALDDGIEAGHHVSGVFGAAIFGCTA